MTTLPSKLIPKVINMEKNIYTILRQSMEYQKISWQVMADKIGASRMGLFKSFKNNTLTIQNMLSICKVLELDPAELFINSELSHLPPQTKGFNTSEILNRVQEITKLCDQIEKMVSD